MECISVLPGRVRFKSQEVYYNKNLAKYIEKYIHSLYGVKSGKVTENTGSILIVYHSDKTNLKLLKENIQSALTAAKSRESKKDERNDLKVFDEYYDVIEKRKIAKRKLLTWSALYLLLKIKNAAFGKFPISTNLNVLKVASIVTIIGGYPIIKRMYKKLTKRVPADSDLLLELTAISFTVLRESSKGILLLILKALDDYIKLYAEAGNRKAMLDSYEKNFRMAWIKTDEGNEVLVPVDSLKIGDDIYVKPGEFVPISGIIEEGSAIVNNRFSTGQLSYNQVDKGLEIKEGMVIVSGDLKIKITKLPDSVDKKDCSPENLSLSNQIKHYQNRMTYISLGTAALSYLYTGNILSAFAVMLVLSPKATSAAMKSGMNSYMYLLNKNNIYLQNPNTFENITKVDKIIFDKTGTLTYGNMRIINIISFHHKYTKNDIKRIFIDCGVGNYYPISMPMKKIVRDNKKNKLKNTILMPLKGLKGTYKNKDIIIGNEDLMKENNIDLSISKQKLEHYQKAFCIPLLIAMNETIIGMVVLNDVMRKDAKELIDKLHYYNINDISLLTGDSEPRAKKIASQLGINKVYSNMNYIQKAEVVEGEKHNGIVMMVGDGVNDALAMKTAHVSVSFAHNSCDIVKLHSDCIIYDESMPKLADLIILSKKSYLAIHRTILFSNVFNILFGIMAFYGGLDIFAAKSMNTVNSLLVLLLNKRILYLKSGKMTDYYPTEDKNMNPDRFIESQIVNE